MNIGFIGLGSMGAPMAENLSRAGLSLCVFDVRREAMERLAAKGARPLATAREVSSHSDVVCVVVKDENDLDAVLDGPDGLVAGARPGLVIVIHSTVAPAYCRNRATLLQAAGIELIDAPVSGVVSGATDGTLSIFVGSEPETFQRLEPMLLAMGSNVFHVGPVGSAQVVKIINNLVAITTSGAVAEGLALARACGLDEAIMLDMINASSGASFASHNWKAIRASLHARSESGAVPWEMAAKDLDLALSLGRSTQQMLPLGGVMSQLVDTLSG